MAGYRAIKVACEGVLKVLKSNFDPADFNNTHFQFEVYLADDFAQPMEAGVSLFLYRVYVNQSHRIPAGRVGPGGQRYLTKLPLDLHFLLTAWGKEASLQHTIIGWMMRVLEDNPIIPPGLLNSLDPEVFHPDETVEICTSELKNEDMMSIWRDMVEKKYQLSIPYMARNIQIESDRLVTSGAPVQRRTADYQFKRTT